MMLTVMVLGGESDGMKAAVCLVLAVMKRGWRLTPTVGDRGEEPRR